MKPITSVAGTKPAQHVTVMDPTRGIVTEPAKGTAVRECTTCVTVMKPTTGVPVMKPSSHVSNRG